jgi:hypothetical protein
MTEMDIGFYQDPVVLVNHYLLILSERHLREKKNYLKVCFLKKTGTGTSDTLLLILASEPGQ